MQGGNCNPDPNQRRVTVMISDVCQPCSPPGDDHIDLQALTFLKVAAFFPETCSLMMQGTIYAVVQTYLCHGIKCGCMPCAALSSIHALHDISASREVWFSGVQMQ